ncbi:MAG: hypothetical protein ACKVRN_02735 [Pyrinomonadaceae bacterium]
MEHLKLTIAPLLSRRIRISLLLSLALAVPAVMGLLGSDASGLNSTAVFATNIKYDFDGDGRADIGRWHPTNSTFEIKQSSDGANVVTSIGNSSSVPAPGDFDGNFFGENPGQAAFTSYSLSKSKLTVYFQATTQSSVGLIFHEALHGINAVNSGGPKGAYSDFGLKDLFGIPQTASPDSITKFINDNCGAYFGNR